MVVAHHVHEFKDNINGGKLNKDGEIDKDPRGGGKINTSKQWLVVDKPLRERGYGIGK